MLHPWTLVAAVYNLEVAEGMRPGPFITQTRARVIAERALKKLERALARAGITPAEFEAYLRIKAREEARIHENMAALMTKAAARTRDDADPDRKRSLRRAV